MEKNKNENVPTIHNHSAAGLATPSSPTYIPITIGEAQPTDGSILIESYRFNIQNLQLTVSTQAAQAYVDYLNGTSASPQKIAAVGVVALPVAIVGIAAAAIAFDTRLVAGTLLAGTTAAGF